MRKKTRRKTRRDFIVYARRKRNIWEMGWDKKKKRRREERRTERGDKKEEGEEEKEEGGGG